MAAAAIVCTLWRVIFIHLSTMLLNYSIHLVSVLCFSFALFDAKKFSISRRRAHRWLTSAAAAAAAATERTNSQNKNNNKIEMQCTESERTTLYPISIWFFIGTKANQKLNSNKNIIVYYIRVHYKNMINRIFASRESNETKQKFPIQNVVHGYWLCSTRCANSPGQCAYNCMHTQCASR